MKTKSKNVFIVAIALAAVSLSGTFALADDFQGPQLEKQTSGIYGHITATVTDENGNVKQYIQTDNRIVGNGTDTLLVNAFNPNGGFTGSVIGGGAMTHMQLGTSTTSDAVFAWDATQLGAATDNCIIPFQGSANSAVNDGGGFAKTTATLSASFNSTVNAACLGPGFEEAGIFDGATGSGPTGSAVMFARGSFAGSTVTLVGNDNLDVDWTFTFTDT